MTIALPDQSSSEDFFLVRMLTDELESGLRLKTERMRNLDCGRRTIVMPAVRNPLVGAFWEKQEIPITGVDSVPGIVLRANENEVLLAGSDRSLRIKASVFATGPRSRFAESKESD